MKTLENLMKIVKVKFINFWPGFNESDWFEYWKKIYCHPKIVWENNNSNPDLIVSSVFGPIEKIKRYNCKKILYTRENINYDHFFKYKNNINLFNLVIGFNDNNNQINIPYYYRLIPEYNFDFHKLKIYSSTNRKNLCLISSNPHPLRLSLLDSFQLKNYIVDCPGLVGRNMDIYVKNKIDFIKNYYFNLCPENSYADGYTTEKLFDCCIAGCVPIYYGCESVNDGFYNKDRILHIKKNLSNYDEIIDKTIYLLNHKDELLEFMDQNPFAQNKQEYIDNIKQKIHHSLEQLLLN